MSKVTLSEKDLSVLSDLLTYEQWAAKKSQMYGSSLQDPESKGLCKMCEQNHTKNFDKLYNFLKSQ